jgi:exonuclease VII small subunit
MHEVFTHLAKRIGAVRDTVTNLVRELEQQLERENETLEQAAYGDDFDEGLTPVQEQVVAALQEALELVDGAETKLDEARGVLAELPKR